MGNFLLDDFCIGFYLVLNGRGSWGGVSLFLNLGWSIILCISFDNKGWFLSDSWFFFLFLGFLLGFGGMGLWVVG